MNDASENPAKPHIVYVLTKGPDQAEIALLPFMHAVGALACDMDASVVLMAGAVLLAQKGVAEHVVVPGKPPLSELLKNFFELGGKLYLCTPCFKSRGYDEKKDFVEGAMPIAAAQYNELLLKSSAAISY
ncbi:MAG: multidrug transporter [Verrucomicrobia bacterium]|nr:multidrug transporter [Verrucomicrobiota bacterium]